MAATENGGSVTPRTVVALTISSWFHVFVIIGTICGLYFAIRADVGAAMAQSQRNSDDIKESQHTIVELKLGITSIQQDVQWFRRQYELDSQRRTK